MRKKLSIICTLFTLLFNIQAYASWNGEVSQPPQNESSVYEISTPAELAWIAASGKSASILLLNDIDFGAKWDTSGNLLEGKEWTPFDFSGTFDGGGYAIKGLYMRPVKKAVSDQNVGFFNSVRNGTVKNLGMEDSYIELQAGHYYGSFGYAGVIAGVCYYATLTNCYNTCDIINTPNDLNAAGGLYVGGIAGYGVDATFSECYNSGNISGCSAAGIVAYSGTVSKSYNTGYIKGATAGGIVGYAGNVSDCYNAGTIESYIENTMANCTGSGEIGGIMGGSISSGSIRNSYNCGELLTNSFNPTAGGLIGSLFEGSQNPTIGNSYYLQNSIVNIAYEGEPGSALYKKTAAQLQNQATFSGWDFTDTWEIDPQKNNGFPVLRKTPALCTKPSELSITDVTDESVKLACTSSGTAGQWEIQYGAKGFRMGEGTTVNVSSFPFTVSELPAGTAYDLYMRAVCTDNDKSNWSEKISFVTAQIPVAIPYENDFENETESNRWTLLRNAEINKWIAGTSVNNTANGTKALYITNDETNNSYTNTVTSYNCAYRTLKFEEAAVYSISYDWIANGENDIDLLRVFLVVENNNVAEWFLQQQYYHLLHPGTKNPVVANTNLQGNSNTTPDGWIALDGGKLNGSSSWKHKAINFTIPAPGNYSLVFFWKNNNNSGANPPAAVDNIFIEKCPVPAELSISEITSENANLTWTENGQATQWEIQYAPEGFPVGSETVLKAASTSTVISNLIPNTIYDLYVRAVCGENLESVWSEKISFLTLPATQTPATIPYKFGFENDTENAQWALLNAYETNKWHTGTAANNTTGGSKALYISNNGGVNNTYSSPTSYVYAYRTIHFEQAGDYQISFDWNANGGYNLDLLRAFLVPEDITLSAGDAFGMAEYNNTPPSEWIALDGGTLKQSSSWTNKTTVFNVSTQGNYNLVFFWKNETAYGGGTYNPPAAVDNILVTGCISPSSLSCSKEMPESAVLTWTENGQADQWEIQYGISNFVLGTGTTINVSENPVTITELIPNTTYDVYVRAVCSTDDISLWSNKTSFTTHTCPPVTELQTADITGNNASIAWTENGNATQWEIQYGASGFTIGTGTSETVTTNPATITGLSPHKAYNVYVRALCSEKDTSIWSSAASFSTTQTLATIPYQTDFENNMENEQWKLELSGLYNPWHIGTATNNTDGGSKALYISNDKGLSNTYLINPSGPSRVFAYRTIHFTETGQYGIDYDWKANGQVNYDLLRVFLVPASEKFIPGFYGDAGLFGSYSTPPYGWIALDGGILYGSTEWQTKSITFTVPAAGEYNLLFFWKNDTKNGANPPAAVDNIHIIKRCIVPANPACSTITTQSANLSWTENSDAAYWEIQYGVSGFVLGTGTIVESSSSPATITELKPNTTYDVFVRAVCSESNKSDWSVKRSFTTLPESQTPASLPYEIDFEDDQESNKWTLLNDTQSNKWHIGTAINNTTEGSKSLYISNDGGMSNAYSNNSTSYVYAYRTIHFPETGEYDIHFDWKAYGEDSYDLLRAFLVPANITLTAGNANGMSSSTNTVPSGWIALDGGQLCRSSSWNVRSTTFTISTAGDYNLVFFWKNNFSGGTNPPAAVDNIKIPKISCHRPSTLSISGITQQNIILTWAENGSATQWEIQYGISGFTLGNGTVVTTDELTYALSNLNPESAYDVYVRAVCSESDRSEWSGKISFTTPALPQIPATLPYETDFENNEENSKWTLANISQTNKWYVGTATNNTSRGTKALYSFTSTSYVYAYRTIHFADAGDYTIHFDWRANGERYNDLLRVFIVPEAIGITSGNANGMAGNHNTTPSDWIALDGGELNLSSVWNTQFVNFTISSTGNYNLVFFWKNNSAYLGNPPAAVDNISLNKTCLSPTALAVDDITSESGVLSWTDHNDASQWEIQYGATGFTLGEGETIIVDELSKTLEYLTPDTQYDIYVRAVCSTTNQSAWSQKASFKTEEQITTKLPEVLTNNIKAYPNPVKTWGTVVIETGSDFSESVIEIYNSTGILVAEYSVNSRQTRIRMPGISGIYLIKVNVSHIETQLIKVIVE